MAPHRQRAATDSEKAVARELAALLKPTLDQIDGKLDTILQEITALKKITAATRPDRRHLTPAEAAPRDTPHPAAHENNQ
jgi:hypothetical protein